MVIAQDRHPAVDEFIQVDKMPQPITRVDPVYPELAVKAGIEGKVYVKVLIGKDGKVIDAIVMKGEGEQPGVGMEETALAAAKQWTFTPAELQGKPVEVWVALPFAFRLSGAAKLYSQAEREVIDKYMRAYNEQNLEALSNVILLFANYFGQDRNKKPQPLLDHHREAWSNPATLGARMTWGKLDGKDVVVVWTRILRADGKLGNWQKGTYLIPDLRGEKIARVLGTIVLTDPEAAAKIIAEPPK
jgi:protein TonB